MDRISRRDWATAKHTHTHTWLTQQTLTTTLKDIDLIELNEAFAAQALAVAGDLEIPVDKLNPNGSGIALGHPIGATGAILAVKALHELKRIQGRYAVVSLCIGGGQGIAALFERYWLYMNSKFQGRSLAHRWFEWRIVFSTSTSWTPYFYNQWSLFINIKICHVQFGQL